MPINAKTIDEALRKTDDWLKTASPEEIREFLDRANPSIETVNPNHPWLHSERKKRSGSPKGGRARGASAD